MIDDKLAAADIVTTIVEDTVKWAIERLSDYPDTKTAILILKKDLVNFQLESERKQNEPT